MYVNVYLGIEYEGGVQYFTKPKGCCVKFSCLDTVYYKSIFGTHSIKSSFYFTYCFPEVQKAHALKVAYSQQN